MSTASADGDSQTLGTMAFGGILTAIGGLLTVFVITAPIGIPLFVVGVSVVAYKWIDTRFLGGEYKREAMAVALLAYGVVAVWLNVTALAFGLIVVGLGVGVWALVS